MKKNPNYSAGPWKVVDGAIQSEQINEYGNFIVVSYDRERTAQDEANLRVAAASPDMLNAIEKILMSAGYFSGEAEPSLKELTVSIKFLEMARIAFLKANGTLKTASDDFLSTY